MAHSKGQKDKIRKSGLSLQKKADELGKRCDVFSALLYWNPTHRRMEVVMHLPRGQTLPDVNRLLRRLATDDARSRAGARVTRSSAAAQAIEADHAPVADHESSADHTMNADHTLIADHEPMADPDANADPDVDAEYETDPDYNPGAAAAWGPVSAYDDFPDDGGVAVGADRPRSRPPRLLPPRLLQQRFMQQRFMQQEHREPQPAASQPSSATSSDTTNNATQSVPAGEHAPQSINKPLSTGFGRRHRRPLGRQAVSLASLERTGGQRVAVDGFGCPRPPAAGVDLRRGEAGLACRPMQALADGRRPRVRMQREQVAKILSLFDELSIGLGSIQFR